MRNQDPCTRVRPLLEPFLDGELPTSQQDEVKAELNRCQDCRVEFDRLSRLRLLVREVYVQEIQSADLDDLLPSLMARVEKEPCGSQAAHPHLVREVPALVWPPLRPQWVLLPLQWSQSWREP